MLAYIKPTPDLQPPGASTGVVPNEVAVPFGGKRQWKSAQLAVRGRNPENDTYDADVLKGYIVELTQIGFVTSLRGLLSLSHRRWGWCLRRTCKDRKEGARRG